MSDNQMPVLPIGTWISTKERLPETTVKSQGEPHEYHASEKVLVWVKDDNEPQKAVYNFGNGFNQWAIDFGEDLVSYELDEVTHWMPLPEAPTLNTK
jgi:hypothetical protein